MFAEVLLDSLHHRSLGLILAQTDEAILTPLHLTGPGAHVTVARKGNGREDSGRSLANYNTPAELTNLSSLPLSEGVVS